MKLNCLRIKVEGFNQLKLIKALNSDGVILEKINKKSPSDMTFTVHKKHAVKTFAILEKLCYNYSVIRRTDSVSALSLAAARAGLIVGLVLIFASYIVSYGFIWHIEISGNENIDTLAIERQLNSGGIFKGSRTKKIDEKALENFVNSMDGIIESSVEIKGTTLYVSVMEDTVKTPIVNGVYDELKSGYDAVVSRIILSSGVALIDRGDVVSKGQVLVSPIKVSEDGTETKEPVIAKIYGKAQFSKAEVFYLNETVLSRTGRKYVCGDYRLFGLNINGKKNHGFENFETETETVNVFENMFVPLKLTRTVFYETAVTENNYTLEEREEHFKNTFASDLIINAGASEVEVQSVLTKLDDNTYRINIYVTAEILIAES